MKLRKHNYTKRELVKAMADGVVFYYAKRELYYDDNLKGNPFVIINDATINAFWEHWRDWQIKVDWKKDISKDNPALCFVSHTHKNPEALYKPPTAHIERYIKEDDHPFKAVDTWGNKNEYKYATPVTAERCWNNGV
ncbi:MAG: hypothetical protein GY928_02600 [Colwellia sp.]|nr:hypothetical protein [Colwellia sp.]